jgi:acetyltransferase-like isoleucine patch superfamily enzyme
MTNKKQISNTSNGTATAAGALDFSGTKGYASRGDGLDFRGRLGHLGARAVIEDGVRIFHPENVFIADDVFVGHGVHLDGYHRGHVRVGEGTWIGPYAFVHGAGGVDIGRAVGIGPRVVILTSEHELGETRVPVLHAPLVFAPVAIADGADIGAGAVVLPGCAIGEGAVVGAGAVVTRDVAPYTIAAGNPARVIRRRR